MGDKGEGSGGRGTTTRILGVAIAHLVPELAQRAGAVAARPAAVARATGRAAAAAALAVVGRPDGLQEYIVLRADLRPPFLLAWPTGCS